MLKIDKFPKAPTIIVGFPGFGLVGTICTEFLLEHLKTEQIGKIWYDDLPAVVAVHKEKLIDPIGIFYNASYNIVIVHAITGAKGVEWKIAHDMAKIVEKMKAKEIIVLEGIGSQSEEGHDAFFFTNDHHRERLVKAGLKPLENGIIIGLAGALLLDVEAPLTCIFAETHSELPDSKAAAKILEAVDRYLNLKVDTQPLIELAAKFEDKLKGLMTQSQAAQDQREKKLMSYVG
ncbi:MAG: PAC2 family protein [Nanoarchaeota archaeon]